MHSKKEPGKWKSSLYLLAVEETYSLSRVLLVALPAHRYILLPWLLSIPPFNHLVNSARLLHAFWVVINDISSRINWEEVIEMVQKEQGGVGSVVCFWHWKRRWGNRNVSLIGDFRNIHILFILNSKNGSQSEDMEGKSMRWLMF